MTYIQPPAPTFEEVRAKRRVYRNWQRGWRQGRYLSEPRTFYANLGKKYRFAWGQSLKVRERMPYSWQEAMASRDKQTTGRRHDPWQKINGKRIGYGPFKKYEYRATWKLKSISLGFKKEWRVWSVYQVANLGGRLCKRKVKLRHKYAFAAKPGRFERNEEYRRKWETGELWQDAESRLGPGSR